MKKAVFFLETQWPIGGSQIMYLNLASYLAEKGICEAYYINCVNDKVEELYASKKLTVLDVNSCDYSQFEDAYFFVSTNYLIYLLARIKKLKKAHILVYFYHPDVSKWLANQYLFNNINLNPLWDLLSQTDSYAFMDESNYISFLKCSANKKFDRKYIPVPISNVVEENLENGSLCKKNTISIGWLGRLDIDKIYSVINALDNLNDYQTEKEIIFYLIGDGKAKNKINIGKYAPKIKILFKSYMYGEKRNKYIVENCDIMVAMGISALDVAMLGIPTVVPIVSPEKFRSDSYIFLFDIRGYSLGGAEEDINELSEKHYAMGNILDLIYKQNKKQELGIKCKKTALDLFSVSNCGTMAIEYLFSSKLDVKKCMKCRTIRKFFLAYNLYNFITHKGYFYFHQFNGKMKNSLFIKKIYAISDFFRKVKRVILT